LRQSGRGTSTRAERVLASPPLDSAIASLVPASRLKRQDVMTASAEIDSLDQRFDSLPLQISRDFVGDAIIGRAAINEEFHGCCVTEDIQEAMFECAPVLLERVVKDASRWY